MQKVTNWLKKFLKAFDFFPATQYLRYRQQPQFKTASGGCASIAIIIILFILFYNLGLQTINKQIIYSSVSYSIEAEPKQFSINFTAKSQFMFAIYMPFFNLSDQSQKYFNITLSQNTYGGDLKGPKQTPISLVQCTKQHLSYNQYIQDIYNRYQLSSALCPPLGHQFHFKGRVLSTQYKQVSIYVQHCNKTVDSACVDDSKISDYQKQNGYFTIGAISVNTMVNPGDQSYLQTYLQERNYYYFNTKTGYQITAEIEQIQINTDVSLLPITDIQTEYVIAIPNLFQARPKTPVKNRYIQVIFGKSSRSTKYTRSFNKIDDYFSYVGGLVGTIIIFFFVLSSYSEKSYVINIASEVFSYLDKNQIEKPTKFNFFYYLLLIIKRWFSIVRVKLSWKQSNRFQMLIQQMQKQLNITYLLKRMIFFQSAIASIVNQNQFNNLLINDRKSLKEARLRRKTLTKLLKLGKDKNKLKNDLNQSSINNIVNANLQQNENENSWKIQEQERQYSESESNNSKSQMQDNKNEQMKVRDQNNKINIEIKNNKIFPEPYGSQQGSMLKQKDQGNKFRKKTKEINEKQIESIGHFDFQLG